MQQYQVLAIDSDWMQAMTQIMHVKHFLLMHFSNKKYTLIYHQFWRKQYLDQFSNVQKCMEVTMTINFNGKSGAKCYFLLCLFTVSLMYDAWMESAHILSTPMSRWSNQPSPFSSYQNPHDKKYQRNNYQHTDALVKYSQKR